MWRTVSMFFFTENKSLHNLLILGILPVLFSLLHDLPRLLCGDVEGADSSTVHGVPDSVVRYSKLVCYVLHAMVLKDHVHHLVVKVEELVILYVDHLRISKIVSCPVLTRMYPIPVNR